MTTRALLIYPPSQRVIREDRCMVPAKNPLMSPDLPPTDLLYLAAMGEAAGARCRITDYSIDGRTIESLIAEIKEFEPKYLLISTSAPTIEDDLAICSAVKGGGPDIVIIAKGSYFLRFDREVLVRNPDLDMIIRGEAEVTFQEILEGRDPSSIKGLVWRGPQGIVKNDDRPYIQDLDRLPFPARHLIDNHRYRRPDNRRPQAVIKVSRGCPYHCFYCLATPVSGRVVRMRSPENIVEEIGHCVERYGIRDYLFWSDIFSSDRAWVQRLCELLSRSGLDVRWSANTRADTIDRPTATAMRDAGCTAVSIGVESGSQTILDRVGKNLTLETVRRTMAMLKEVGLVTIAYYLIGLPWETRETARETARFAVELDSDFASFFVATPFPGTAFHEYALNHDLLKRDEAKLPAEFQDAYYQSTIGGHHLSREEIDLLRKQMEHGFYFRPSYVLKRLGRIRSPRELLNYARAAAGMLSRK